MQKLIISVVKALVDEPEQVIVTKQTGEDHDMYEIRVAEGDLGKVIGKQGRIAKAIRVIVQASAAKNDRYAHVEIIEPNNPERKRTYAATATR